MLFNATESKSYTSMQPLYKNGIFSGNVFHDLTLVWNLISHYAFSFNIMAASKPCLKPWLCLGKKWSLKWQIRRQESHFN